MRGAHAFVMMALAAAFLSPIRTSAQTPPARDSLLPVVRARLAHCDSTQTGATFITTAHERKLDGDGNVENETVYRARVYTRDEQEREILLAMWEDGVPVEEKTLRKEQEKREKDRRKRAENARAKKGDSEEKQSSRVMEPFLLENESKYQFPVIIADTMAGVNTWRVTVEPLEESEDYVRGFAWVAQDDCRPIAERYEPARMPSRIQALQVEIDYTAIDGCPMPERFRITGSGKALIFIKFNFQAEIHFDSVSINPDLPDSLFSLPED